MSTPSAPGTRSFNDHLVHHAKGKKAPAVPNAPTAENVLGEFNIQQPNSARGEAYAGEHSATMAAGKQLHTRHDTAKTQAAAHDALVKKDVVKEFHASESAYQASDFDPSKLGDAERATYDAKLKAAKDAHNAKVTASKQALADAGLDAHSHVDLTHEALNQRAEAASAARLSALEQVEKDVKAGTLTGDAAIQAEKDAIEAAFKKESAQLKAAGAALETGRKEVATATGVASKWEKGAATELGKVEKQASGIMGKVGGLTSEYMKNWRAEKNVVFNKAKVAVGTLAMIDGARRGISDIASMMSGQKGVDKNGEPLPQPGIMNLAFDAGEFGAGLWAATTKMGRGH